MAIPTFNSIALCSAAARDEPGAIDTRCHVDTMPGIDGEFVQLGGSGGRDIRVSGMLEATGDTPAESNQSLKAAIRGRQALADGSTLASYVGTDGATYDFCILKSYRATGSVQVCKKGQGYAATVAMEALIRDLSP